MQTKNITSVEQIEALDGTEKLLVNSNGTLKQILPRNANFGGGKGSYFVLDVSNPTTDVSNPTTRAIKKAYTLYKDMDYTPVTAQEVYDALTSGMVTVWNMNQSNFGMIANWLAVDSTNKIVTAFSVPAVSTLASSSEPTFGGDPTDVVFIEGFVFASGSSQSFTVGTNPAG